MKRAPGYPRLTAPRAVIGTCGAFSIKPPRPLPSRKGPFFEIAYRRLVSRLGHNQTIGAIAHRLCHLIWIILHRGVAYEERGPSVNARSKQKRTSRMIRELRLLGYRVEPTATPA